MQQTSSINRRNFLKLSSLTSAALFIGFSSKGKAIAAVGDINEAYKITPYVIIEKGGKITIMNPRPEMGQGTYQSVPALIAEELEVALDQVTIEQTSGEKEFGRQVSGGSSSVRGNYKDLRKVGASARAMLIKAASDSWQVPVNECYAENAKVFHKPTGKGVSYADLAEAAAKVDVPQQPQLKDPKDFKILGKSTPRQDIPWKTSGKAMFGIDAKIPGMVCASIERCPVIGGKLTNYDDSEAMKVAGVQKVVKATRVIGNYTYEGVAVVADNYWAALQGRKALKITWDNQGYDKFNSKDYEQSLRDLAKTDGLVVHNDGDFDRAFADAPVKLEAFYETPVVSHSPMEPMNCTAYWQPGDVVEIWVSSQGPTLVKSQVANAFNISEDNVKVHIFFNGGGFGRRLGQDFAIEAASISKQIGKPVKLVWSREDDTQFGPFRPMTFSAMRGALSSDGKPVAFSHKVISPSLSASRNPQFDKTKPDGSMTEGISDQEYQLPNMKNFYVLSDFHIPIGPWRSVTSSTVAFPHECFIDELAVKAGKDPMQFRLDMLKDDSDTKRVLMKLKEVSNWDQPLPKGSGRGVAQYKFFAGLAGYVVQVSTNNNAIKIDKVFAVIDLGTVVNPDNTKAQVEGGMTMALSAAIKNGISFENGVTKQTNFNNNPIVRINEAPEIETYILAEGGETIKGVGEPGVPPFAPALANAIFAATGKRIRKMPFDLKV
jgi:isoquinoline 1-oxidoreductase beta subunit